MEKRLRQATQAVGWSEIDALLMAVFPSAQEKSQTAAPMAARPALGVYVHVPFCATTCDFCAFYQTVPKADAVPRYLAAIKREMELVQVERTAAGARVPVATAFWGGGTPGLLRPRELEQLGRTLLEFCGNSPAEWSVELAPATVTGDRVSVLRDLGVTRLSLGVQSFRADLLDALGRQHTPEQVYRAYELIRGAGFPSVNLDLMFALPGQSAEQWQADLAEAVRLAPDHLSTYCLTFEEDTALWVKLSQGRVKLDVEKEAAFYTDTWRFLESAGYAQYEISNFARPGHVCRHNLNTWRMNEWIGFGPSAASQHAGWRASNPPDLAQWHLDLDAGNRATADRVPLTEMLLAADSVIFGLRMNEGVSLPALKRRFPAANWNPLMNLLPKFLEGLLTHTPEGVIQLTPRGRLLADAIGAEILEVFE
jgi:oxygen-independent coproporphyrinogen III oxidase